MDIKTFIKFFQLLSTLLLLFIIIEYSKEYFATGSIIVSKRAKHFSENNLKDYCILTKKQHDLNLKLSDNLKVNCSQVPGPIIKLDVGDDNYLRFNSRHYIAPGEYCALKSNPKYGKLCPHNSDPLWRKCCVENEIIDSTSLTCRQSRIKYRPNIGTNLPQSFIIPTSNSSFSTVTEKTARSPPIGATGFHCANNFVQKFYSSNPCLPGSNGIFKLTANGTPMYETSTGVFLRKTQFRYVEHDSYCIDGILDFSSSSCAKIGTSGNGNGNDGESSNGFGDDLSGDNGISCKSSEIGEVLFLCSAEEPDIILNEDGNGNDDIPKAYFFAALWLSTCPLLLTSAIVNSFIIQKNVHGWILTSYLISMFLVNINSVVLILDIQLPPTSSSSSSSPSSPQITESNCGILDFTMKFIYLSSLCWMSSMCMNMLRTFSSSVPQVAVEPHRFLLSALFSLGFPIIAVSLSYYVGSLPDDESLFQSLHKANDGGENNNGKDTPPPPQTCGKGTCALYSYKTLPYYSGPIIFLVLCNVLAFLRTSTTIASLRRQAEAVLHKQTRDHLESFALFAKLFLLTGSIWVIRVVLLVLQIQGLYVTWYGVALESVFSIPEVVFPMIIFHHPEFIKWASRKSPIISRLIVKCSPFCRKDISKDDDDNSPEFQSANQMSSVANNHSLSHQYSSRSSAHQVQIQGQVLHHLNQVPIQSNATKEKGIVPKTVTVKTSPENSHESDATTV